jgi:cell division protein FtsX
MGVLASCGADKRQLSSIFLLEFVILFTLSSLIATSLSSLIMYILFKSFLEIQNVGNLSWMLFRIDPLNTLLHLAAFFIVALFFINLTLRKQFKEVTVNLMRSSASGEKLKHYAKRMAILSNPVRSLVRLFQKRNERPFIRCLVVVIPVIILMVFVFNYMMINIEAITKVPDYEITLSKEGHVVDGDYLPAYLTEADLEYVKGINGVSSVQVEKNIDNSKFLVKDERARGPSSFDSGDALYNSTKITPYSKTGSETLQGKYDVAVSKNHAYLKYKLGDKILLYDFYGSNMIEVTVAKLLDMEWTDRLFAIQLNEALYTELTATEPINKLLIKLVNPSESSAIAEAIAVHFNGTEDRLMDEYSMFEKNRQTRLGYYIFTLIIFGLLFTFMLIIIYTKLSDYIASQRPLNRILHILGALSADIFRAYSIQTIRAALFGLCVSFAVGFGLLLLFFNGTGYHISTAIATIAVQVLIAALVFLTFFSSVGLTLNRQLKIISNGETK